MKWWEWWKITLPVLVKFWQKPQQLFSIFDQQPLDGFTLFRIRDEHFKHVEGLVLDVLRLIP